MLVPWALCNHVWYFLCLYSFKTNVHITLTHLQEGKHCQFSNCVLHTFTCSNNCVVNESSNFACFMKSEHFMVSNWNEQLQCNRSCYPCLSRLVLTYFGKESWLLPSYLISFYFAFRKCVMHPVATSLSLWPHLLAHNRTNCYKYVIRPPCSSNKRLPVLFRTHFTYTISYHFRLVFLFLFCIAWVCWLFCCSVVVSPWMELINIIDDAATQNTRLHYSLLYDSTVLCCCLLYFALVLFALFIVNFVFHFLWFLPHLCNDANKSKSESESHLKGFCIILGHDE